MTFEQWKETPYGQKTMESEYGKDGLRSEAARRIRIVYEAWLEGLRYGQKSKSYSVALNDEEVRALDALWRARDLLEPKRKPEAGGGWKVTAHDLGVYSRHARWIAEVLEGWR